MIVSIEWLKEFVNIDLPAEELADLLTNAGLEADAVQQGKAIEIDLTPNRPDCMSHIGVAREIAILTNQELRFPSFQVKEIDQMTSEVVAVEIADSDACPRYACRIVRNVKPGPSPSWMVERLETVGIRAINNVVDISNYVLMEMGHPLHTFDLSKIRGNKIVVRKARTGETHTTLDGETRPLNAEHLLICDAERGVALAGIMGGENSEVSDATTDILIESAYFDPVTIRKGAKALGLRTEASKRFERGMDYEGLLIALDRTAALLHDIAGGEVLKGLVDAYPRPFERKTIHFRQELSAATLGTSLAPEFIENTFRGLEIEFSRTDGDYNCIPPTFRPDLEREIDLTEELARVHGYGKIDSAPNYDGLLQSDLVDPLAHILKLKRFFVGLGFHEAFTNSLLSERESRDFFPGKAVQIQNPLSVEMSTLRTSLFPGLLKAVAHNLRRGEKDVALFEYGEVFSVDEKADTGCGERSEFSGVITGNRSPKQWKGGPERSDFFSMKGCMSALAAFLKLTPDHRFIAIGDDNVFSQGQVLCESDRELVASFGIIPSTVLKSYGVDELVFGFTLNLALIREIMGRPVLHTRILPYPGISRDLCFAVDESLTVGQVEHVVKEHGTDLLKRVSLYDLYQGKQLGKGQKSVTFNLFFQRDDRTLRDEEVDEIIARIISEISNKLNAKLR